MSNVTTMLEQFVKISSNPKAQLDAYCAQGKKVIGCLPVYCPEELVLAADMVPFGVWGAETEVAEAKKYFPAFLCSIAQTSLEMGLRGDLDQLSAVMIPILCDTLKSLGQNWKVGVKNVEFIPVTHPQNRKLEGGVEFLMSQYRKIKIRMEEISGNKITDEKLNSVITLYNEHRAVMREFVKTAAKYPQLITPAQRCVVIKSGYFMTKPEHTKLVRELIDECCKQPVEKWNGSKVVVTGIIADSPSILEILEQNKMAVVADEVAQESRQFRTDVPACKDPIEALARQFSNMEGCSVLYDPDKKRADMIVDMVKANEAQGVIVLLTKFCDPEEFDYPILKKAFDAAGIPSVMIEVDQQMRNNEQARTAIQTFADVLNV